MPKTEFNVALRADAAADVERQTSLLREAAAAAAAAGAAAAATTGAATSAAYPSPPAPPSSAAAAAAAAAAPLRGLRSERRIDTLKTLAPSVSLQLQGMHAFAALRCMYSSIPLLYSN